jgi:flagellar M-ring protein FliF
VRVHADLDFDQRQTTTQSYQFVPGTPPLTSSSSTENYSGSGAGPGGVLGSGTTGVTTTSATQGNSYQKKSTNDTNAVGSVQESRTGAPGSVKRLTVAVLVNAGAGSVDTTMLSSLVANAVGLDPRRGDTIQVEKMTFDHSAADAAQQQLQAAQSAQSTATILDLARKVGVVLLVLLVLGLAFLSSRKQRRVLLDAEELAAIRSGHEPLAITWPDTPEITGPSSPGVVVQVAPDVEARRIEQAHADVSDLVARQPDEVAQLLRGWIAGGR